MPAKYPPQHNRAARSAFVMLLHSFIQVFPFICHPFVNLMCTHLAFWTTIKASTQFKFKCISIQILFPSATGDTSWRCITVFVSNGRNQLLFLLCSLKHWYSVKCVWFFFFLKWVKSLKRYSDLCSAQRSLCSCVCALMNSRATDAVALACDLLQGALHTGKTHCPAN